jgi:tetratricopeptide (TPR) repeat protein
VVSKTDGVPLFVEELTKTVLESGLLREQEGHYELTGPLPSLAIPVTLHDSLMARLDRLGAAKEVAQLGVTLGREFPYAVLQAVAPVDEATLQQALARLVEAELLYQRGLPPQVTYLFKHALIQDLAYQSLLKRTRQQYHQQIAHVLEARLPETAQTQPELLAHHYTEAGLTGKAITYWQRAGTRALERSAHVEAISHLSRGLELLKTMPETLARLQRELSLHLTLGPALIATRGQAASEVEHIYARARELCRQVGDTLQLFPTLWGLSSFYLVRPDLKIAREIGEQLLRLAQRAEDPALLLETHRTLGSTLLESGDFAPARVHLEQGIAIYDRQRHRTHAFLYGRDPGVVCLSYAAQALWLLGYPDQARQRLDAALTLAPQLSHPFSVASTLFYAAILHQLGREVVAAQERTEALLALATEHEFAQRMANGLIIHGWALVKQGRGNKGMAEMQQGLAAYAATGAELTRPYFLGLLGEGYGAIGQAAEGLRG